MSFQIGQRVGGYEFIDFISSSKDGVAFKVRNILAHRFEMLKVLPENLKDDHDRVSRFFREVKLHASLLHPNIVTFFNAMELERELVMTTELVEGTTLADRLARGPLPWKEAIGYVSQVLAALGCAHEHGVVHRDITPQNMIITPDGVVKLAGFGLAKTDTDAQLTQLGTVVGSVRYISPEQVKAVTAPDPRSDIYSVGVVLYEALTGRVPFDSKSQFEIMLLHVNTAHMDSCWSQSLILCPK